MILLAGGAPPRRPPGHDRDGSGQPAAAADKWEALVGQAETITYSVDLGDIQVVVDSDGRLVELTLHPSVTSGYTHGELAERLNLAIAALREEVEAENQARYGGALR
jgi:Protein of unknown function (DUF2710)